MADIIIIACVDRNLGIGDKDGNLLFDIPNDLKHFKKETDGQIVVMGRKTFDSLGRPLKNRKNYVLTSDPHFTCDGVTVLSDVKSVLELATKNDIFIIGGGTVYKQFITYASKLIITHVDAASDKAVTFFPTINESEWTVVRENKIDDPNHEAVVKLYERI